MDDIPHTLLGDLDPDTFLAEYWQKRPLLVRGALPGFHCPLRPEELAGLALQDDVESRIVVEKDGERPWQVEHGPFPEDRFATLPPTHWTLLVQEVNRHVPEVAALLDHFRFLPDWRIDDVMVSYAPEFGSVGPHTDNYDVFLLQGLGRRRWAIGEVPAGDAELLPDVELRILREFEPEHVWVLEPGDMLYLPPGLPHHGVSEDDECMTYSVGFRAPSHRELLTGYLDAAVTAVDEDARYGDAGTPRQTHPGELTDDVRERIRRIIRDLALDDRSLDRWFGHFITEPRNDVPPPAGESLTTAALTARLRDGARLYRSEYSRFAYFDDGEVTRLFIDGEEWTLSGGARALAPTICDRRHYRAGAFAALLDDDATMATLARLVAAGHVYFPDDE